MKKNLFSFALLTMSICIFSSTTFAQDDAGGAAGATANATADGGGTTATSSAAQPLGVHFSRNNGDGSCGDKAQIRLYYTVAPTVTPVLTQIYYQNEPLYTNLLPVNGNMTDFASKGYISFCLPTANIPPALKLTLTYSPSGTAQPSASISGTD